MDQHNNTERPLTLRWIRKREGLCFPILLVLLIALGITLIFCTVVGSVNIPLQEIVKILFRTGESSGNYEAILLKIRLPRVLNAALVGAALSISGTSMQGLLKNPLADGSTLGVSSGASLGAVLAIALGLRIPGTPYAATTVMAVAFAAASLFFILMLSHRLDYSLSTHTILLMGIIFGMFVNSIISMVLVVAEDHLRSIVFWTMGSLNGSNFGDTKLLAVTFVVFGSFILSRAKELNAFALGESIASNLGVDVQREKMWLLIASSSLIGVTVAVSGTIGFVGLVIPHMSRLAFGSNHKTLLPISAFIGAIFLLLTDLMARTLFRPQELPIGVITSFFGSLVFVYLFAEKRRSRC